MSLHADLTHCNTIALPQVENAMSRRYLQVLMRWVPVALRAFNVWPEQPHCGHFFGGVFWYGLETSRSIATLALVASSPEFDPGLVGCPAVELRQIALQGLRYLCLTTIQVQRSASGLGTAGDVQNP